MKEKTLRERLDGLGFTRRDFITGDIHDALDALEQNSETGARGTWEPKVGSWVRGKLTGEPALVESVTQQWVYGTYLGGNALASSFIYVERWRPRKGEWVELLALDTLEHMGYARVLSVSPLEDIVDLFAQQQASGAMSETWPVRCIRPAFDAAASTSAANPESEPSPEAQEKFDSAKAIYECPHCDTNGHRTGYFGGRIVCQHDGPL